MKVVAVVERWWQWMLMVAIAMAEMALAVTDHTVLQTALAKHRTRM